MLAIAAIWYAFKILTFNSLPESESKDWLDVSEILLIVSTIGLVFGLVGEWPDSESWKKRFAYKIAKALVIIGVVGELLGDAGIFVTSRRLQLLQDIAVTIATDRATDAGFDAALANNAAGEANEHARLLEKDAQELRSKNLALEEEIAPRRLNQDQLFELTASLEPFKGRKIRIESYFLDTDGEILASQIKAASIPVFVSIDDWIGGNTGSGPFAKGINVTGRNSELVNAFAKALDAAGLKEISTAPLPPPNVSMLLLAHSRVKSEDVDAVVLVGVKPLASP
jgi:hypothetical protein